MIREELEAIHHIVIPGSHVGILLSKVLFTQILTYSGGDLQSYIDDINAGLRSLGIQMDGSRIVGVAATYYHTKCRFLFVLYHGKRSSKEYQKIVRCYMLLKLCEKLKESSQADYLVIGGDFNLHITRKRAT